jgi:2-keto-4-pentenoate hydratase/2-oxohepta-3-ene-1,7-dioic acid hydratase in catechol pathway
MQDGRTRNMVFPVAEVIVLRSRHCTLALRNRCVRA